MTLSDSLPIQFWAVADETFNEKTICGLRKQDCFCQPFQCDDTIVLQYEDIGPLTLRIYDSDANELGQIEFSEVDTDIWQASFSFNDFGVCDKQVQLKITSPDIINGNFDSNLTGWEQYFPSTEAWSWDAPSFTSYSSADDTKEWYCIVKNGSRLISAGGSGSTGEAQTSDDDGKTWTAITAAPINALVWTAIAGDGSANLVVVSTKTQNTSFRYSTNNGDTWLSKTITGSYHWKGVAYGNGIWVAVNSDNSNSVYKVGSPGGTWSAGSLSSGSYNAIIYAGSKFVAIGYLSSVSYVKYSSDGLTWSSGTPSANVNWTALTYGNGLYVAVASTGEVMTSPDAITWTNRTPSSTDAWTSIAYANDYFMAVSSSGTMMKSLDGITWSSQTIPASNSWQGICWGTAYMVAVSKDGTDRVMVGHTGRAISLVGTTYDTSMNLRQPFLFLQGVTYTLSFILYTTNASTSCAVFLGSSWPTGQIGASFPSETIGSITDGTVYSYTFTPTTEYQWINFRVKESSGGAETVGITAINILEVDHYKSDCIDVKTSQDCTQLIEYSNTDDFDGITYTSQSPDPIFYLRIPALFYQESNPQEQEDIDLTDGVIVTLLQEIQEKTLLETGYMPNYMHKKLQKVLMCDTIIVDGNQYRRRDPYQDTPVKGYNLKKATVLLTRYDSVERNTI